MRLESYQTIENKMLVHSGHTYDSLAEAYGTPLYIFDEESFRERVMNFKEALKSPYFGTELLFASKSILTLAIARLIAKYDIGQDVVSSGEIYTAIKAGVDPTKIYFHGNNKLNDELAFAIDNQIGTIVIDNRMEAVRLQKILESKDKRQRVLLRINPGVEAHTHEYIKTANLDSKFGESVFDENIEKIIKDINDSSNIDFAGFHCHIGSQIFDSNSFFKAADEMLAFAESIQNNLCIQIQEINFGGGFGVYYTEDDTPFDIVAFIPDFLEYVHKVSAEKGIKLQKVTLEPGRSLVNNSGSTLYTIGDIKKTVGGKEYLFIDGGMTDNIRPALYQAEYEAALPQHIEGKPTKQYTIAGKACESGDIIVQSIQLPQAESGDLLLVNGTGAYNYSMASNYNHIPIPAMIHIDGNKVYQTVKRQSFEDVIANNINMEEL
ncbi:diaminopimelate decarboxylase [Aerococcaceae bacterium WGS1372]